MKKRFAIACFALLGLAWPNRSRAQFTGNNQTNVISGVTSNWTGDYYVGSNYVFDALFIQNNGVLSNGNARIGYNLGANSNAVVVSGSGSIWTNAGNLTVGWLGAYNSLVISNGGAVCSGVSGVFDSVGPFVSTSNNSALVTGSGSLWRNAGALSVGGSSIGNKLVISNGGRVASGPSGTSSGEVGQASGVANNSVLVTGSGSVWTNSGSLYVGDGGHDNSLVISNGGAVIGGSGYVGYSASGSNNTVLVTGSGSTWSDTTNSPLHSLSVGYSGSGNSLAISNGGTVTFSGGCSVGLYNYTSNNSVLVTGNGSVLNVRSNIDLVVGGQKDSLTISNGGAVFDNTGSIAGSGNNTVLVTGSGSIWSNSVGLSVGADNAQGGISLLVNNGGRVSGGQYCDLAYTNSTILVTGSGSSLTAGTLGFFEASKCSLMISNGGSVIDGQVEPVAGDAVSNSVVVTGIGSVWSNAGDLFLGYYGRGNSILVSDGGKAFSNTGEGGDMNVLVTGNGSVWSNTLSLGLSSLTLSNGGALVTGRINPGIVTITGGTLLAQSLAAVSPVSFSYGTLTTSSTAVTNGQQFVVGDGTNSATFHLLGGVHSFNDGLRIRTNSFLTGCGRINGSVTVDLGGTVLADGCGALTLTGTVTNNGVMIANNGSFLQSSGTLVNNGKILLFNGGLTNFSETFINHGIVVDGGLVRLNPRRLSSQLVLSWTEAGFSLQTAPALTATFTNIPAVTSPYTNPATPFQQFFRLKLN